MCKNSGSCRDCEVSTNKEAALEKSNKISHKIAIPATISPEEIKLEKLEHGYTISGEKSASEVDENGNEISKSFASFSSQVIFGNRKVKDVKGEVVEGGGYNIDVLFDEKAKSKQIG